MNGPGLGSSPARFTDDEITKEWTPPPFLELGERCEWRRVCTGKTDTCYHSDCFHEDGSYKEAPSHHVEDISWTFYLLCGIIVIAGCVAIYFAGVTQ